MKAGPIVAIDLGGTNLRLGLISPSGRILRRRRFSMENNPTEDLLHRNLYRMVASFLSRAGKSPRPKAVAIGFAGLTRSADGLVYFSPNVGRLSNLNIRNQLEDRLGMPVLIENDANCAAVGEFWQGAGRGAKSLFLFTLGTGVGGSLVIDGEVWEGHHGIAGEVGHTVIDMDGPRCNCGNRGCLEAMVSAPAIVRTYMKIKEARGEGKPGVVTSRTVVGRARRGEKAARAAISEAGRALGTGIANVFGLLNPELILIGGGVSRAGPTLIRPAVKHARNLVCEPLRGKLKVRRAQLGDDAGLLGAAYLALKRCSA